jgi:hypothetical protein
MWITVPAFLANGIFATNRFHLQFGHASAQPGLARARRVPSGNRCASGRFLLSGQTTKPTNFGFSEFILTPSPNHLHIFRRLVPHEGRIAIVTDAGRDAVDAGGALTKALSLRTAKPCGPDTPTLVSSW